MATIKNVQGTPLFGSPIIATVTPAPYNSKWSFHHIVLVVHAVLVDGEETEFSTLSFSTPVETKKVGSSHTNLDTTFDISTALQAVAEKYEYSAKQPNGSTSVKYPYVKFFLTAYDDYIYNGSSEQTPEVRWPDAVPIYPKQTEMTDEEPTPEYVDTFCYAVAGAFSEYERLTAGSTSRGTHKMTRKPATIPEIVFAGSSLVRPAMFDYSLQTDYSTDTDDNQLPDTFVDVHPTNGPKSLFLSTGSVVGPKTLGSGADAIDVYVTQKPVNGYEIRFVNSLGCLESVHIKTLRTSQVKIVSDKNVVTAEETFNKPSHLLLAKNDDYETWKMTTGALDMAWAAWYVHEFIMAQKMWIKTILGNTERWIPCNVLASEKVNVLDETKKDLLEIQFDLQLDMTGSVLEALTV